MSAMNRKMFSNRDARTKLAGMGGILASSPELMGATQRFETAGLVTPRGVPDSPRLSDSLVSRSPIVSIGGRGFYVSEDKRYIVDEEGNMVRDPSILNAVLQVLQKGPVPAPPAAETAPVPVPVETVETLPPQTEQGIASVLSARGVPPEATANRQAALSRLKEQFSELSLFPERDSGELETIILNQPDVESGPISRPSQGSLGAGGGSPVVRENLIDEANAAIARDAQQEAARVAARAFLPSENPVGAAQQEAAAQASADRFVASLRSRRGTMSESDLEKLLTLAIENEDDALIDEILIQSGPRTESSGRLTLDSDFGADLSPDMVAQLNRLEKLRTARGIADRSNPIDQFLSGANLVGGALADTVAAGSQLGLEGLGYISGGGDVSDFFFDQAQGAKNVRTGFRGGKDPDAGTGFFDQKTKNFAPRLFNPSEGPTVEAADKLKRAEIEQDSIRTFAEAVLSGNTDLFAEGSVAGDERSAFSELDRSSPVDIGLSPNELAAEEFSQRPDTQDPLTDERLIDIVMAASADGPPPVDTGLLPSELAAIAANNTELGYTDDQMGLTTGFEQPYLTDDQMGLTTGPDFKYVAPNVSPNVSGTAIGMAVPEADVNVGPEIVNDDRNYLDKIIDRFNTNFDEFKRNRDRGPEETEEKVDDLNAGEIESEAAKQRGTLPVEVVAPAAETDVETGAPKVDTIKIQEEIDNDPGNAGPNTADALLRAGGIDTSNMSVKDQTVAMKKMLTDLMGQTDADEKEQFWMNMAMVGFGIASGESSDAMKNIADGLLAGTAQISKNTTDKKARDDKFTLTAFGEVLADKRAREKFGQDKILAGIRSSSTSEYTPARERSRIKEVILSEPTMFAQLFGDGSIIDPIKLKKYLDKIVPGSSGEIETITTLDSDSDSDSKLPVVNSAADYAALEVDQYFMQMKDGVLKRFKKT